jgi:membrane protein DedA with SNARE-associated domain
LQQFLETYGYLALFIGTFLEGETVLALAGLAAYQGWMSFPLVVSIATIGGFIGDQFFFFLGRHYGDRVLQRYPSLAQKAPHIHALLRRWDAPLVITIRFMYGLRIAGPIVIGSAGIAPWRLAFFNFIGALIWAPMVAGVGYMAGQAISDLLANIERVEIIVLVLLAVAIVVGFFIYRRKH